MRQSKGLTLVEMLATLAVLALLALMGWRGLETQIRSKDQVSHRMNQVARLQTALAQWTNDLQAAIEIGNRPGLDYDGKSLRITRLDPDSPGQPLRVVAWSRRAIAEQHQGLGSWIRWQSAPLYAPKDWARAWAQAGRWAANPSHEEMEREVVLVGLEGWQLFYFRDNSWSNPLSSPGGGSGSADEKMPEGIRLVLQLSPGQALEGRLVRDWIRTSDTSK